MIPLVLLRPQPGNDASAGRARAMGLDVVQAPLFETVPVDSGPLPQGPFDAVLLTSANGARFAPQLPSPLSDAPLYAVGAATAHAARGRGHGGDVHVGGGDARSTVAMMVADGRRDVLHLCGADVRPFDASSLRIVRQVVYRARPCASPALDDMLARGAAAVVAIHSPRAGSAFADRVAPERRATIRIAAISAAAAEACGSGWACVAIGEALDDTALLACAETLCNRALQ